jgi:hypothetical protein
MMMPNLVLTIAHEILLRLLAVMRENGRSATARPQDREIRNEVLRRLQV